VPVETSPGEWAELRELIRDLTARVFRIEQALGIVPAPAGTQPKLSQPVPPPSVPASPLPMARAMPSPGTPHVPARAIAKGTGPDLESRIGSHWLNRTGIAAVLIGVSYFLKFAFDNNWIGPAGRVAIGLVAGIAVVVWSESFRARGYKIFSYSLKAVGIGVLYLSLWAAFQVYSLFSGGVAFAAMVAVTAAIALMAVSQDAEILAAFAFTGGFLTPVLLSTGQNRELALFLYVALLDVACVVMVVFKPWRRLLVLSYVGTLVLYLGWYSHFYERSQLRPTLAFATLFFAVFAVAPLVARRPEGQSGISAAIPLFLAFVNAGAYFLEVYVMLDEVSSTQTAWFALALAAAYIFLSRQAQSRYSDPTVAPKLRFLHLALAIGFITIAIPIRLETHWITIGWFVEAAVLLWVADRIHSDLLNAFALLALVLGVARLLFVDDFYSTRLIFNARMATHALAIAVLAAVAWYASRRGDETGRTAAAAAIIALNLLALIALSREVADYYAQQTSNLQARQGPWNPTAWANLKTVQITRDFAYSALWMSYGAMLMIVGFWRRSAFVRWQALVLIAVTTAKVFVYDLSQLDRAFRILSFIALGVLLLAISFVYQRDWLQLSSRGKAEPEPKEAVQP
jgi:uncharacterized membrane protein